MGSIEVSLNHEPQAGHKIAQFLKLVGAVVVAFGPELFDNGLQFGKKHAVTAADVPADHLLQFVFVFGPDDFFE